MDIFDKNTRSQIMRSVKGKGNKSTELKLFELLRQFDCSWEKHAKDILGKPDFILRGLKLAIFVDGSFWHGHETKCRIPKTNQEYWINKINKNKERDKKVTAILRRHGWSVIRIWDFELKDKPDEIQNKIKKIVDRREKNSRI